MKPITYNKQYLNNADKNAVKNVINQKFLTNGNSVKKFENKLEYKEKKVSNYLNNLILFLALISFE